MEFMFKLFARVETVGESHPLFQEVIVKKITIGLLKL